MVVELGNWYVVSQCDPRVVALYRRHYSGRKVNHGAPIDYCRLGIAGPGQSLVMLTADARAVFGWVKNIRDDGQAGVNCFVFRNEGDTLSSSLIIEADTFALNTWPDERRHFTFVDPVKTARCRSNYSEPGECFIQAGWRRCGETLKGLVILEKQI